MKRIHLIVHGLVQGVFFRASTIKEAKSLNLVGYAKNLEDGTVEIIAEGSENKLNKLVDFCKNGPEMSRVDKLDIKFETSKNKFKDFEIQY
ncbi:acylphosphatase [Candidatus Woesearchaeota archaeon]|nr:acylphosphatase [Candidatus Woesearchaeota archaeon]